MDTPLATTLPQFAKLLQVAEAAARKLAAEGMPPVFKLGLRLTPMPLDALRAQFAQQAVRTSVVGEERV